MERPQRKHPRLKTYDYSLPGYYYITIHGASPDIRLSSVGRGLAPAEAVVRLTGLGECVRTQLLELEKRYPYVIVDKYVIMPTHIHLILRLTEQTAGDSQRLTVPQIVGAFKSLATRFCNQWEGTPGRKLFQTSFYEQVLRNERAYQECWRYIDENPEKWLLNPEDR